MVRVMDVKRGDIFLADLSSGNERMLKPVLVLQNDLGNKYMDTTIIAELPDFLSKVLLPTHVALKSETTNLGRDVVVLTEHLTTIRKERLKKFIGRLGDEHMEEIGRALKISLSLD
jgi:mRNA interferase MazF